MRKTTIQAIYAVLHDEPLAPSAHVPGLDPDLETICLACLEKDPADRYASAHDLAEDLARFLRHEPITMRPPTIAERFAKWRHRNPQAMRAIAGVLVVLLAVATLAVANLLEQQAERRRQAEETAERERQAAERERMTAATLRTQTLASRGQLAAERLDWRRAAVFLAAALEGGEDATLRTQALRALDHTAGMSTLHTDVDVQPLHASWGADMCLATLHAKFEVNAPGKLRMWDRDGQPVRAPKHGVRLEAPAEMTLVWILDGSRVATCVARDDRVRVWDAKTGGPVSELAHDAAVSTLAWSASSRTLATADIDGVLSFWDERLERRAQRPTNSGGAVTALTWSPDGKILASGGADGDVRLWSAAGDLLVTLTGHTALVSDLTWFASSRRLCSGSWDGAIRIWNMDVVLCEPPGLLRMARGRTGLGLNGVDLVAVR